MLYMKILLNKSIDHWATPEGKATFFAVVLITVFIKIMILISPKEIWNYPKKEYAGDERTRDIQWPIYRK